MRSSPLFVLGLLLGLVAVSLSVEDTGLDTAKPGPELAAGRVLIELAGPAVHLRLLARRQHYLDWLELAYQAKAVTDSFTRWYGPCALPDIWIVDVSGTPVKDSSAPGLVFLNRRPLPYVRIQERELTRLLARQWFYPAAEDSGAWFAVGLAAHAASRYLASKYGPTNLLDLPFSLSPLSGLGEEYVQRVLYHIAASNRLLVRLDTGPAPTSPLDKEMYLAQAGLVVSMLRRQFGPDTFDQALRSYREKNGTAGIGLDDFIRTLSLASRRNVFWMVERWQRAPGTCDYAVAKVRTRNDEVEISLRQHGMISMPLEIEVRYKDGTAVRHQIDSLVPGQPVRLPVSGSLRQVVLDPDCKLLEPNRWNNYWPRKVEVKPLFALPSFDAYQIFYGPYAWYDTYHGFQLGAWTQGREFVVAGPLRGRHMWTLSETYSTKIDDWHTSASYITPLSFISDRLRASFLGDYSLMAAGVRLSLLQELGRVFGKPNGLVDFGYRYFDLYDTTGRDFRAWEPARTGEVRIRVLHSWGSSVLSGSQYLYLGRGLTQIGGNYRYWKMSLEEDCSVRLAHPLRLSLRLFCGAIPGSIPDQDQFYLSGGLQPSSSEPVSWGLKGKSSAQEHWHYDSDANCRGFAGEYRHGRFAYGVNVYLEPLPFLAPFFDLGNVTDSLHAAPSFPAPVLDAGVRLKLGPLYADFPFWRWSREAGHEFAFRWMLGLKLGSGT